MLCLASSITDLKERLSRIIVGYTYDEKPVTAGDLKAAGAMAALLKDALKPNLVQTLEGTPAFIHGGPFANIAHGCNSVMATRMALKLGDYAVTEGKLRRRPGRREVPGHQMPHGGLTPDAVVLVATVRALKHHGGCGQGGAEPGGPRCPGARPAESSAPCGEYYPGVRPALCGGHQPLPPPTPRPN